MKGFSTEQELVDLFKMTYNQKFDVTNTRVLEEVGLGFGIADLVITELKDSLSFEDRERLNPIDISIYQVVSSKRRVVLEDLINLTGVRKNELRKSLDRLIDYEYVKETDSGYALQRKYEIPFKKSFAFEAKLKNWKRAFMQAYRYKWFAHYSYVIMDEAHAKPAIKQVAHFKNHNVGLLTLSVDGNIEIHHRSKKQPPVDPKMQILLSENILYQ